MWSVKCEVWSVKEAVRSEKFGVWSVKCGVWSLKFGVRRVQCAVWGVECRGKDTVGTGCLWTIGHLCLGNFRRRLARVYVRWYPCLGLTTSIPVNGKQIHHIPTRSIFSIFFLGARRRKKIQPKNIQKYGYKFFYSRSHLFYMWPSPEDILINTLHVEFS